MAFHAHIEVDGELGLFMLETPCRASPDIVKQWLSVGWDTAYQVVKGDAFWALDAIDPAGEIEYCVPYRGAYVFVKPPKWIREVFDV